MELPLDSKTQSGSGDGMTGELLLDGKEPDKDAIKMFVGQIPKSWDEETFREYLEEFGEIYQLNILRDKVTNDSKGYNKHTSST